MQNNNLFNENNIVSAKDLLKKELGSTIFKDDNNNAKNFAESNSKRKSSLEMSLEEYLSYTIGRDPLRKNAPNSTVSTTLQTFTGELDSADIDKEYCYEVLSQRQTSSAEVKVYLLPNGFTNLDIVFDTGFNPEMTVMLDQFQEYYNLANCMMGGASENPKIPIFQISIMPLEFIGESYIMFENPIMYVQTSSEPGISASLNMIRILFKNEDVSIIPVLETDAAEALDELAYVDRIIAEENNIYKY